MDLSTHQSQQPWPPVHHRAADHCPDHRFSLGGSSTTQQVNKDLNSTAESGETCPICGDKVSGYHYGLLTCESCKGFFKRSVQNNKHYTCAEQQRCPVNLSQRKRCPFCRFQKCLAVGMKREAVRPDRMRGGRNKFGPLYRRDRQMKQQRSCPQANSAPYRIKRESTHRPGPREDLHPAVNEHTDPPPWSSAAFPPPHLYPCRGPGALDCTATADRTLNPPSPPCPGRHSSPLPAFAPEKGHLAFSGGSAPAHHSPRPSTSFTPRGPAGSTLRSTSPLCQALVQTPDTLPPPPPPPPPAALAADFLGQLMVGEQDEGQLCAKVLSSLQREQANRGQHDRLNTFSIMCKMADQTLFALVEWARNTALFKELKVEDQMVLLQSCWSELLVLDHLSRQVTYCKDGCIYLVTGQQIEVSTIVSQAGETLSGLVSRTQDLVSKLKTLHLDRQEFVCLKYLVLFNPDVKHVQSRRQVEQTQERVNRALMEHTQRTHPGHSDKFGQLLLRLPEVRSISLQVEEYLYQRHLLGDLPCNSLLAEMLHTKHN